MFTIAITASVGRGGINFLEDVATVQELLNLGLPPGVPRLTIDGAAGPDTVGAIESFQRQVVHMAAPDGRIDRVGRTFSALLRTASPAITRQTHLPKAAGTSGIADADFSRTAKDLGCEVATIKAVADVEAKGHGFYASGRPKILFEAHQFSRLTAHRFDRLHPTISSATWNPALYSSGELEYGRLLRAAVLDREAALRSASWGRFQIMGFNHVSAGHSTIGAFVDAMFRSETAHLKAFAAFITSTGLAGSLKNREWATFAKGYNGPEYAKNAYDTRLKDAYTKYNAGKK